MAEQLKEPFLRPNLNNTGTLPDGKEPVAECPDIWCAGDEPVFDFQKVLASEESYQTASDREYTSGVDNYFYIRVKNGSDKEVKDLCAKLYYAPASVICWPSQWKAMAVENHAEGDNVNQFDAIQTQAVGVVKAPFILPGDLSQENNYCFIAQIYSDEYPNPFPSQWDPIYIANLFNGHLLWGQRNIANIPAEDVPQVSISTNLSIPAESLGEGNTWLLNLHAENADKFQVEVRNSRTDDTGKQVVLEKMDVSKGKDSGDGGKDLFIGRYHFNKGYRSELAVYIYNPEGIKPAGNEKFILDVAYSLNPNEYKRAKALGILDEAFKAKAVNALREDGEEVDDIKGVVRVGSYTIQLQPNK